MVLPCSLSICLATVLRVLDLVTCYIHSIANADCPQQAISIGRITDRREHYHNPNVTAAELTESVIHVD